MIDYDQFKDMELMRTEFANSKPFPMIVIDGFLESGYCEKLADGFVTAMKGRPNNNRNASKGKCYLNDPRKMSPDQSRYFDEINSERFLSILTDITGIKGLYPDTSLKGGGLHNVETGGFLKVHTDFNRGALNDRHRALNLLLYLNPRWQESWGGCLEIWTDTLDKKTHTIVPIANRAVLFRTSDISFHGHPIPVSAPDGVSRKSIAAYYYEDWPANAQVRNTTHYVNVPKEAVC